jgi:hypothetical protein
MNISGIVLVKGSGFNPQQPPTIKCKIHQKIREECD